MYGLVLLCKTSSSHHSEEEVCQDGGGANGVLSQLIFFHSLLSVTIFFINNFLQNKKLSLYNTHILVLCDDMKYILPLIQSQKTVFRRDDLALLLPFKTAQ
jgi:hypothetical protein